MRNRLNKVVFLLLLWGTGLSGVVYSQSYPEVPAQVPFGGLTIKFDQSARNIIASDIRVLMINQKYWEDKLERALLYFPIIESVFIREDIPDDFKFLAAQESSLIPDAVSASNAVGFWQFKEETARELGLRVDRQVDERKNISSSTRAAAAYLKKNNQQLNNWVASLYSYYQGFNGALEKMPAEWPNSTEVSLNGKHDRYVLRFFAYKIAFETALKEYQSRNPVTLMEASTAAGRSLDELASELRVNGSELKNYNIWFKGNRLPTDKTYFVTVPVANSKVASFRESLAGVASGQDQIPAAQKEQPRPSQTISEPVRTEQPKQEQPAVSAILAQAATEEVLPTHTGAGYPILRKQANQPSGYNMHIRYEINGLRGILARAGDYPNTLANAAGLSVAKFRKYNDLDVNSEIVPGEVYYLEPKYKKARVEYHVVQPGETLESIAHSYGLRLKELLKYNRILSKKYYLETGRELWLTKKRPSTVKVKIHDVPRQMEPQVPAEITQPAIAETQTPEPVRETATPVNTTVENKPAPKEAPAATGAVNTVPKNASERVRYTPKLADKKPETPNAEPAKPEPVKTEPARTASTAPAAEPRTASTAAEEPKKESVVARPNSRIVIVSEDERPKPYVSRRASNQPADREDAKPIYSPAPSGNVRQPAAGEPVAETRSAASAPAAATAPPAAGAAPAFHTVARGETLYSISRKYNLTITELLAQNNMKISDNLVVGKRLKIAGASAGPTESAAPARAATAKPAAAAAPQSVVHTVKKGETLFSISQKYRTTVSELTRLNALKGTGLKIGQKLKVPSR